MEYTEYMNNHFITNYIKYLLDNSKNPNFHNITHPIIQELEMNYIIILNEFLNIEKKTHFWPEKDIYYNKFKNFEMGKGWDVFGLWEFGKKNIENCQKCPLTCSIFEKYPEIQDMVGFSILRKKTHIIPHCGWFPYSNSHIRGHLGLIIPENKNINTNEIFPVNDKFIPKYKYIPNCAIKVREDIKIWNPGKIIFFDDIYEHSAWNFSDQDRVILLFDLNKNEKYKLKIDEQYIDPSIMYEYFNKLKKNTNK